MNITIEILTVVILLSINGCAKDISVVGEYSAMDNSEYHVIAYTNDALIKSASNKNRGFATVLKVVFNNLCQHRVIPKIVS